jgi:hypothetical protein
VPGRPWFVVCSGVAAFSAALLAAILLDCSRTSSCKLSASPFFLLLPISIFGLLVLAASLAIEHAVRRAKWYRWWLRLPLFALVAAAFPQLPGLLALSSFQLNLADPFSLALALAGMTMAGTISAFWRVAAADRPLITEASSRPGAPLPHVGKLGLAILVVVIPSVVDGVFKWDLYGASKPGFWAFDLLKFVVVPLLAGIWLVRSYGLSWRDCGLRRPSDDQAWGELVGASAFVFLLLTAAYYTAQLKWLLNLSPLDFYRSINPEGWMRVPVTLYMAGTAAVTEELFGRALPLLYLERRFPGRSVAVPYILGSAALFSSIHWENGPAALLATFTFGVVAAGWYWASRDLRPLVCAHFLIDLIWLAPA